MGQTVCVPILVGTWFFSLLQSVQTSSEAGVVSLRKAARALSAYLHFVPRLRMSRAVPLLPLRVFVAWTVKTLPIPYVPSIWIVSPDSHFVMFSLCNFSVIVRSFEFLWNQLCCGNPFVLSYYVCALEQLFCCTVMNLRGIKISVKFCDIQHLYMSKPLWQILYIHIMNQRDALFEFYFWQYPLHVSNRQAIHHQEVTLYAAFGMYHAFIQTSCYDGNSS